MTSIYERVHIKFTKILLRTTYRNVTINIKYLYLKIGFLGYPKVERKENGNRRKADWRKL